MSQSIRPTRPGRPRRARWAAAATARLTEKVDLPTPPLPEAMATANLVVLGAALLPPRLPAPGAVLGAVTAMSMTTSFTAGRARRQFSTSRLRWVGIFGSAVVMARATRAVPSSRAADLTRPKETMSRLKPGYLTCLRCSLRASGVMREEKCVGAGLALSGRVAG